MSKVEGMEVGLTVAMKNRNGNLELTIVECGCYMQDLSIILHGGASWFYQGYAKFVSCSITLHACLRVIYDYIICTHV